MSEDRRAVPNFDPILLSRVRLGVICTLISGKEAEFTILKSELGLTSGNLSVQLRKLEEAGYLKCRKRFVNRKPRSTYRITQKGRKAFENHIRQLEKIVKP